MVSRSPESIIHELSEIVLDSGSSKSLVRKRKRAFHRVMSGLTRCRRRGERIYHMTLPIKPDCDAKRLSRMFQTLRKRIEHKFKFRVEYWKTNVGGKGVNPHMHIIFKVFSLSGVSLCGKLAFIPQKWLSFAWKSITGGSSVVWIGRVRNSVPKKFANYMVAQYITGQGYMRQSWSWNWVFRGFVSEWYSRFSAWYKVDRERCLSAWSDLLCSVANHFGVHGVQLCLGG